MINLKILHKFALQSALLLVALNAHSANESGNDFCVYVDPISPYYNPNKLSSNQLEECKIRAATIIEIQALHYDILKQRFPNQVPLNSGLPSQAELAQSIDSTRSSGTENETPQTQKNKLVNPTHKPVVGEPVIRNAAEIAEVKRKPLYHSDAGRQVEFNYEVIVTEAGRQIADTQIEEIKAIKPVTSISTAEAIINSRNPAPQVSAKGANPVDMILARQNAVQSPQIQPNQMNSFSSSTNRFESLTTPANDEMRIILESMGATSSESSNAMNDPSTTVNNEKAQEEPLNTESLELLQQIKANGESISSEQAGNLIESPKNEMNQLIKAENSETIRNTNNIIGNKIEKYNKSAVIEPIPSI
ncbi:hypothetical protein [Thorsellia kenyensis]|uniref:Uncharacterized protein n=1 Tax=Thorsellia kenyensis TaxID=1549888 RepID=A0ABV6C6Q0_9GAMM